MRFLTFVITVVGIFFYALFDAQAQNPIFDTTNNINTMNMLMAANESSKPTLSPAPKLYRERVPGKPEEGFVPVVLKTTAPPKPKNYVYTKVDYPYGEILIFDDFARKNVCYITAWNGRIATSCVPMK